MDCSLCGLEYFIRIGMSENWRDGLFIMWTGICIS